MRRMEGAAHVLLLIAIPLMLGWVVARYWIRFQEWPALYAGTATIGLICSLVGVNFFYRRTSLEASVAWTLALEALVLAVLWFTRPKKIAKLEPLSKWAHWLLIGLSVVVGIYANAQQIANPDDDYWIHAPLQGLMRHGNFPPFNPFFSDIPMNGHYGRNLSIVIFSYLSGLDVFVSQHVLTSALQVLTLWLFYAAFYASSGRRSAAMLATAFVFFGINAGGRGGLVDTMQNNNAFVHLYLSFLCLMTVEAWKKGTRTVALIGGLALGSYAIVYETHFGLVFLTILGVTPILWARGAIDRRRALCAFAILALSLPLAFTQGGPLTDILDRKIHGREHSQAEELSKGMQNQAQVVKVTFPKKELFQILLETGEYQRISHIYRLDTPLKFLDKSHPERGYAYIWSWDVLKIHFLPLYLLPWSAFVLWRRNSLGGLFMGAFGTIAFLVPGLVNFGPIYESEYYRWEFAAALGFAGALGLTLATLTEKSEGRPFKLCQSNLVIRPAGKRLMLIAFITFINSYASLTFVGSRLAASVGPNLREWLIFPSTQTWLTDHQIFDFNRLDYEAATWLEERIKPGDRLLVNFREENNFSILYESTLTGISGARCVGHALPLEDEKIGTTPFRRSPSAQVFWATHRPEPLAQLKVDWIFYKTTANAETPDFPGATLLQNFKDGDQIRQIYQVDQEALPKLPAQSNPSEGPQAELSKVDKTMRGGHIYPVTVKAKLEPDQTLAGVIEFSTIRDSDGLVSAPSENLLLNIQETAGPDGNIEVEIPFVAPHDEGGYQLYTRFFAAESSPGLDIGPVPFRSSFSELLKQITIESVEFPSEAWGGSEPWGARQMLQPKVKLNIPPDLPKPRDVLAGWAFYSEERGEFDLLPGNNLRRVVLSEEFEALPMVTPKKSGTYRLSLYLSSGQGHLTRVVYKNVTIDREKAE
jgi:hypothetical protein